MSSQRWSAHQLRNEVLLALQPMAGQLTTREVAQLVGKEPARVLRALNALEREGKVKSERKHRYDPQPSRDGWGSALFGGAAVCIRRFKTWTPVPTTPPPA